jgi:hypothetical protein
MIYTRVAEDGKGYSSVSGTAERKRPYGRRKSHELTKLLTCDMLRIEGLQKHQTQGTAPGISRHVNSLVSVPYWSEALRPDRSS